MHSVRCAEIIDVFRREGILSKAQLEKKCDDDRHFVGYDFRHLCACVYYQLVKGWMNLRIAMACVQETQGCGINVDQKGL